MCMPTGLPFRNGMSVWPRHNTIDELSWLDLLCILLPVSTQDRTLFNISRLSCKLNSLARLNMNRIQVDHPIKSV